MTSYTEQASQLKKQYTARLEALRNRRDLSDEGRKRQIAKLQVETKDAMRKLAQANNEATEQRQRRLLDRVFGTTGALPSQIVAQRDAMDRAAKIKTADEAAKALELARFTGDHTLAKAIAMRTYDFATGDRAISGEWVDVLNRWAQDEAPAIDEALTELSQIHADQAAPSTRLTQGMQFSIPDPSELAGKNADMLARSADTDDLPEAG